MSYFHSKPFIGGMAAGGDYFPDADEFLPFVEYRPGSAHSADRAIDSALRSVPLPEGLLTRLGMLVHTMGDDATDRVDYLGC